jgi:carotenoid cleavage dioxygenase
MPLPAASPPDAPVVNPYLEGNFAPVTVETTAFDLPVRGKIPAELEGRLLRIGPNPVAAPDPSTYHWFMGTGMAHGLRLRGGKAEWYRNRYVLSNSVAATLKRPALPGPRENTANTNIVAMGGATYAIIEAGGLPVELSYTLDSVARSNLGGTLKHGFAAHPKLDPRTGLQHVLTYEPGLEALTYLVVDERGLARDVAAIPAAHGPMVHDVAFTATSLIVLDLPVTFDRAAAARGFPFVWNPERMPRVGLLPLDGDLSRLRWIEAPSCYVFHVMNAFDDGDAVVVDIVRHPRAFDRKRSGPGEGAPVLARWRVDRSTGRLSETILDERGCEFPRFNDAFAGRSYRYGYTVSLGESDPYGPVLKHDVARGRAEAHHYGAGRASLEPVFVARPGATEEDDGWIMSYVYDATRDASDVVILDAQDFAGPPVATITLPVRVPFGFHGNWVPDQG